MDVFENQSFTLPAEDVAFLQRRLGGFLEHRVDGWAVCRVVGHVALPSGTVLRVRSPKAATASLLSWLAYVDPSLASLRLLGRVPEALYHGDVAAVVAQLFVAETLAAASRHELTAAQPATDGRLLPRDRRAPRRARVPHGHLDDRRSFHFTGPAGTIRVDVAELDTSAPDLAGCRHHARRPGGRCAEDSHGAALASSGGTLARTLGISIFW